MYLHNGDRNAAGLQPQTRNPGYVQALGSVTVPRIYTPEREPTTPTVKVAPVVKVAPAPTLLPTRLTRTITPFQTLHQLPGMMLEPRTQPEPTPTVNVPFVAPVNASIFQKLQVHAPTKVQSIVLTDARTILQNRKAVTPSTTVRVDNNLTKPPATVAPAPVTNYYQVPTVVAQPTVAPLPTTSGNTVPVVLPTDVSLVNEAGAAPEGNSLLTWLLIGGAVYFAADMFGTKPKRGRSRRTRRARR